MAPKDFMDGVDEADYKSTGTEKQVSHVSKERADCEQLAERQELKWLHIVSIISLHLVALYGAYYVMFRAAWQTWLFSFFMGGVSGLGVTGGAHRLWTHRTYKAKLPLRILLAACFSVSGQNTLPQWVLDHRVHHKYSETNADPHNSNRGFFFAHVGWLMQKKHPDVIARGKQVDMSDIYADPVVIYHTKYFLPLKLVFCFALPMILPVYWWGETPLVSVLANIIRYTSALNATWLVNSAAHLYGNHPFSTRIRPAENVLVALASMGEGWHNYHHVFPWDYRAAEMGYYIFNLTTAILDGFAAIGWAYDLKYPSKDLVERVARRFGDGSHHSAHHHREVNEDGLDTEGDLTEADVTVPEGRKMA